MFRMGIKGTLQLWNERFYRPDVIPDIRSPVSQSAAVSGDKLTEQTYTTYTLFLCVIKQSALSFLVSLLGIVY